MSVTTHRDQFSSNDFNAGRSFHGFSPQDCRTMRDDDLSAGRSVAAVLITIVTLGMLVMLGTVLMVL